MKKKIGTRALVVVIGAFALLTLFLSSSVIFDWFGIRAKEGNYVLFVVWANFISSIIYLISAYGLMKLEKWSYKFMAGSAILLLVALIGLFVHIDAGGIYEQRTVGAMIFRTTLTVVFGTLMYLRIERCKD